MRELQEDNRELKQKLGTNEAEVIELRSGCNKIQREYDKIKHELIEASEKSVKYQNLYENMKAGLDGDKHVLESKITELNEQLDEYAEAYKVLEEKYKDAINMQKRVETSKVEAVSTPAKREDKKVPFEQVVPSPASAHLSGLAGPTSSQAAVAASPAHPSAAKDPESNEAIISGLKKKVSEDVEAKKALRELIKQREDTIKKQKESIDAMQKQLDANKSEIQYAQSQQSQKNSQAKMLTSKINELNQELEKYKKGGAPPEEKKSKPKTAASIVKQKLKEEKLEKVEAKPYLFGPKMDHDDLEAFNNNN